MSRIEEMQAASSEADHDMERQSAILQGLRDQLERISDSDDESEFTARTYSDVRARVELQESRVANATAKARGCREALDTAREAEAAKLAREQAQRMFDQRLSDLRHCEADLTSKREAVMQIQRELPLIEQRRNLLLGELDRAKTQMEAV
jgi:hypothetical protein